MLSVTKKLSLLALSGLLLSVSSCKKDDPDDQQPPAASGYVLAIRAQGTSSESADYLLATENISSGEVSVQGKGLEQNGWRYYAQHGSTVFSVGYGDNSCIGYQLNAAGQLEEKGRFVFEKSLDIMGYGDENTLVAMESPRGGTPNRIFHLIDATNISITKKVTTDIYMPQGDTLHKWPTSIHVRGNKLFLPFYPLVGSTWETPNVDTAYIAVYSYPELKLEKVMKDTRTGPIGLYGTSTAIMETENGDFYTISPSSLACGYTKQTKPSAILKVRNGTTEFDDSYFFDFEAASGGHKLEYAKYVGNGIAVGRMIVDDSKRWGAYDVRNPVCKLCVINLNTKTVTEVSGVPQHGGQYDTPSLLENGKVYMSITTATDAALYEIDPATATGKPAAKILGQEAQGIFKVK